MQLENISFFVSSTFNDMHAERDALHLQVMPQIAKLAAEQMCSIQLLDLRWGVDTSNLGERESAEKVLRVCLDGIDKCHPFMLILIGDRYGWIPEKEYMESTLSEHSLSDELYDKSVTELEIQYGLMMNQDAECFIYFREIDYSLLNSETAAAYREKSERGKMKLEKLKEKLREKYPSRVRTYSPEIDPRSGQILNVDSFTRLVTQDIRGILLSNETDRSAGWEEQEKRATDRRLQLLSNGLIRRDREIGRVVQAVSEHPLVVLTGDPGSGKTSILCQSVRELRDRYHVLPFFCGNSQASASTVSMLKYFIHVLEDDLRTAHLNEDAGKESGLTEREFCQSRLSFLCRQWHEQHGEKVLLMIDALDQMPQTDELARFEWAPEGLGVTWACLASALDETRILRDHRAIRPGLLTAEERATMVRTQFARYGKGLDGSVIELITSVPGSENPLYLRLVLARLLMLYRSDFEEINRRQAQYGGAMQSINHYLGEVISSLPKNTEALCAELIIHAAGLSTEILRGEKAPLLRTMELIAVSRYGLRLCDLEEAVRGSGFAWNALQFEWLRYFLDFCFLEQSDGRINFSHRCFRSGLLNRLRPDTAACHALLARTLAASTNEAAFSDAIYHIFRTGPDAADLLEKVCIRIADERNMKLRTAFMQMLSESAEEDGGALFLSFLDRFSTAGRFHAAVVFTGFLDRRAETAGSLKMLRDVSAHLLRYTEHTPGMDELKREVSARGGDGNYLEEVLTDDAGLALEIQGQKAQLLIIRGDAVETLEGEQAALEVFRQAVREADRTYEMRVKLDRLYASFPPVYIAHMRAAELCLACGCAAEGAEICRNGIRSLRSLSRQVLFTGEHTDTPAALLLSQMARMAQAAGGAAETARVLGMLEQACADAQLNYEYDDSSEALHALFQTEAALGSLMDDNGRSREALQIYAKALEHGRTLCARDYSVISLDNLSALLINISVIQLREGDRDAMATAEEAEKTAREAANLAPDNPEPQILRAYAKTVQTGLLLANSLRLQAADLCYELLDGLEPWLDISCPMESVRRKCTVMSLCSAMLLTMDEPDTAALCCEFGIRYARESGDSGREKQMSDLLIRIRKENS